MRAYGHPGEWKAENDAKERAKNLNEGGVVEFVKFEAQLN